MEFICLILAIVSILLVKNIAVIGLIVGSINILMSIAIIKIKEERGNKFLSILSIIISIISVILGIQAII